MPLISTPMADRVFDIKRSRRMFHNTAKPVKAITRTPAVPKHIFRNGEKLTLANSVGMGTARVYMKPGAPYNDKLKKEQVSLLPLQMNLGRKNSTSNATTPRYDELLIENEDVVVMNAQCVVPAPGKENIPHLPPLRLRPAASTTFMVKLTGSTWAAINFGTDRFDFANGGKFIGSELVECDESCLCKKKCDCANPQWVETRLNCDGTIKQYNHHGYFDDEIAYQKADKHNLALHPCGTPTCTTCVGNTLEYNSKFTLGDSDIY